MKFIVVFIGLLIILAGLLPLLNEAKVLSLVLPQGTMYYLILIVLGLILLLYETKKQNMFKNLKL